MPHKNAAKHPLYSTYANMKTRCYNPNNSAYKNYGARGIKICDRWLLSFWVFLADMGEKPSPDHSIDRIDNNGDYSPENCRWATQKEQMNNVRHNRYVSHDGRTQTLQQWADELGLKESVIRSRIDQFGMSLEDAFTKPIHSHNDLAADNVRHKNAKPITFNGETHTMAEWARRLGVKTTTISRRVARLGVERALGEPILPHRPAAGFELVDHKLAKPITFEGETHTVSGWAAKRGIPYTTLKWRINRWGVKRALGEHP